jgi:alanine dehydrogenase
VKTQEHRVGLLPSGVYQLRKQGHEVIVERGAGIDSGYPDSEYELAGAKLVDSHEEPFRRADLIVKVKEPVPGEYPLLSKGQILFTYLHLAASRELTDALLKSGATAIAYETVTRNHRLPLLEPMSEIAGRMSVIVGGHFLAKPHGGKGVLLGGVPGVLPGKVVVLGGGTSGVNAARMATGLGADVTILEVDVERMRFLDITMSATHTLYSSEAHFTELLPTVDLLIGAVLVPGAKAPKLISRAMLRQMKPGSVFVDIAIDQGGCAETSRPTTHDDPVYRRGGRAPLLRHQHARRLRPHRDPGADQRDLSLHRGAGRTRPRGGVPETGGAGPGRQCAANSGDLPGGAEAMGCPLRRWL